MLGQARRSTIRERLWPLLIRIWAHLAHNRWHAQGRVPASRGFAALARQLARNLL